MVASRHLQGTIISRVTNLLQSNSLKKPPLWYDVVRRFPPPETALLSLVAESPKREIPKIQYPDDDVKRELYKNYNRANRDPVSLQPDIKTQQTKTEYFLSEYHQNINNGCSHDEALEISLEKFKNYLPTFRTGSDSVEDEIIEEQKFDLSELNIYDIFVKEKK